MNIDILTSKYMITASGFALAFGSTYKLTGKKFAYSIKENTFWTLIGMTVDGALYATGAMFISNYFPNQYYNLLIPAVTIFSIYKKQTDDTSDD